MCLTKQIEQLCHQVSEEKDDSKLLSLVDELNRELARISEIPEKKGIQQPSGSAPAGRKKLETA
jgi:hypothetical protein